MNANNNGGSKQVSDYVQEPRISFRFKDNVNELPASKFDMLVNREVMKFIDNNKIEENLNSEKFARSSNVRYWKRQYDHLLTQASMYENIIKQLEKDLKINKQAQPMKNWTCSVNQNVDIYLENNTSRNMKVVPEVIELSDDDVEIDEIESSTNSIIVDKKQETKFSSNNLIGSIEEFQKLKVKYKPGPTSKTSNVTPNDNHDNNCNNEVVPISVEACKSTKSKTMFLDHKVNTDDIIKGISNIETTKDGNNKTICLNSDLNNENCEEVLTETDDLSIKSIKIPKIAKTMQQPEGLSNPIHDLHLKKSKIGNVTPSNNHNYNFNNEILPISVESCETTNRKTCLTTFPCKRKLGLISKSMFLDTEINGLNNENCNQFLTESDDQNKIHKLAKITKYPPPYPTESPCKSDPSWKNELPAPICKIKNENNMVTLIWDMKLDTMMAQLHRFELFVCQETDAIPNSSMWRKLKDIKLITLPMACDIHKFIEGYTYYFALRAVDVHNRKAPFAVQKTTITK